MIKIPSGSFNLRINLLQHAPVGNDQQVELLRLFLTWLVLALDVVAGDGAVAIEAHGPPERDAPSSHLTDLNLRGVWGFWANTHTALLRTDPIFSTGAHQPAWCWLNLPGISLGVCGDPDPVIHLLEVSALLNSVILTAVILNTVISWPHPFD